MQETERVQNVLRRSATLDASNEAAKNLLAEIDALLVGPSQVDTPAPEPMIITESEECRAWKAAISTNRASCDPLLGTSYEDFFLAWTPA